MAKDFSASTMDTRTFEDHAEKLLKNLLYGNRRVAAITSKEVQLMGYKSLLQQLNRDLDPSISQLIEEMRTFVYPSDIALFLIAASKEDLIPQASDILDSIRQDRRLMSLNDLLAALAETANMPGAWAASLFGEMDAERDATPEVFIQKSTIDLSAMRRGMGL